jgi:uncharacterized protein (DUF2252 family)
MAHKGIRPFSTSRREYEAWLREQLRGDVWAGDLREKARKMRKSPFVFLRATYWRWAEEILTVCPDLRDAPQVLAVGDIHLENYGVWRDQDGRLVWGVNDYDEAAPMPYALDLVRLAASAVLSGVARGRDRGDVCAEIRDGYRAGLKKPRPFALDEKHRWLRALFVVSDAERRDFWQKMKALDDDTKRIPARYRRAIERQWPGADAAPRAFARRVGAGTGSLGRPRWAGIAMWRGGRVVREAKALVRSAWTRAHPRSSLSGAVAAVATGRYRAPDPWYDVRDAIVVRRLSPNARKIEVKDHGSDLGDRRMLHAMAYELANVHLGNGDAANAIRTDLKSRGDRWLDRATLSAAKFVTNDHEEYCG